MNTENIINESFVGDIFKRLIGKTISDATEKALIKSIRNEISKTTIATTKNFAKGELNKALRQIQVNIINDSALMSKIIKETGIKDPEKLKSIINDVTTKSIEAEKNKAIKTANKAKTITQKNAANQAVTNFESILKKIPGLKLTKNEIKTLENAVKTSKSTTTKTKNPTKVFKGGKFKNVPIGKLIRQVIVRKSFIKWAVGLGIGISAIYLIISNHYGDDMETQLIDENGNVIGGDTPTNTQGKTSDQWSTCIQDLIKNKSGVLSTNNKGVYYVVVKNTGDSDLDSKGGVLFFTNGKIRTYDNSKSGTWSCKSGQAVVAENENIIDLDIILENINKINNMDTVRSKSIISEQLTNEISLDQMGKYVDSAVVELDGWVDTDNLKNLYNIVNALKGKTYQGQDALQFFMSDYKADEGESFVDDVNSVGVETLGTEGRQFKNNILSIISGKSTSPTTTPGTTAVLGNINITWDSAKSSVGGTPTDVTSKKQTYKDCTDFPFEYGCRNQKIKDIQVKIGFDPKYQTGNFGPITLKKLIELGNDLKGQGGKNYITKELYDKIIGTTQEPTPTEDTITQINPDDFASPETRENEYLRKYPSAFNAYVYDYKKINPNATNDEILKSYIEKYQADFNLFSQNPTTYGNTQNLQEDVSKIKEMFKRIL